MRKAFLVCVVLAAPAAAWGADPVYEGTWLTTNRKLDGTLTCVVSDLGKNQWRGHFSGAWQGTPFSYTVNFIGPPEKLHGTAVIDGASYEWTGTMTPGRFKASFTGNRYLGSFDMKRKNKE